ncbi:MAG TPA: HD domain-containing protein [Methanoculleus thermophilus]|nr:HD domain-containing protein [Bacillota bacterium]HQD26669.1 HD domain-containing protein [Methanoculleus thermophilus]
MNRTLTFEAHIRDPLYGYIGLTWNELRLLDTPPLQRLRRIKQLANAHLVYPAACHTRFEHSLGVLHVATLMARQLQIEGDDLTTLRYAALLHDIGHGPFSHVFEAPMREVNGKDATHEAITRRIIREDEEVNAILGEAAEDVAALLSEDQNGILHQIISGNIDADKMDYLRRDSYHTGVAYGSFDLERVLHTLRKTQKTRFRQREDLAVHEKGIDAIESLRLARFLMHAQVYYHHTNVVANGMLQRAIKVAIRDGVVDAEKLRNGRDDFLEHYLALDDARLLVQVLTRPESTAADLVGRLERRDLFKRGYESNVSQEEDYLLRYQLGTKFTPERAQTIESAVAEECGCDPDYIVADLVKIENSLFKSASTLLEEDKFPFLIERKDGTVTEIDSFSTLTYNGEPRTIFYLFCPEEHRQTVQERAGEIIAGTIG